MKNSAIVCFDVETGGRSWEENPITEIAMITLDSKTLKEINRYSTYIKPYADLKITEGAIKATNINMNDVRSGADIKKVVDLLIKMLKEVNKSGNHFTMPVLVGHNVAFDIGFLSFAFAFCKKDLSEYVFSNNGVISSFDTMALAARHWGKTVKSDDADSISLGACAKRIGIELKDAHGALPDTIATVKLFQYFDKILQSYGKKTSEEQSSGSETEQKTRRFFKYTLKV